MVCIQVLGVVFLKPVIGITPSFSTDDNLLKLNIAYCKAVTASGGIPLILSYTGINITQLFNSLDGIIFSGGGDIDPLLFYEEPEPACGQITPERDFYELSLCKYALCLNIPVLGICRGAQLMAISDGGAVFQDINTSNEITVKHSQNAPKYHPTHYIKVEKNSKLNSILSTDYLAVNSFHHQAVSDAGKDFIVSARSNDGLIEAIEHTKNIFAIGVQWHPEFLYEKSRPHLNLFKGLVDAAKG